MNSLVCDQLVYVRVDFLEKFFWFNLFIIHIFLFLTNNDINLFLKYNF